MGTFIILPNKRSHFYFMLVASTNEIVMTGEKCATKEGCKESIAAVKSIAKDEAAYLRWHTGSHYYFNLKAGNGDRLATSEAYTSSPAREYGMAVVKAEAADAPIADRT